jgi:hypothetical protein
MEGNIKIKKIKGQKKRWGDESENMDKSNVCLKPVGFYGE